MLNPSGNKKNLVADNRLDEFTEFRQHLRYAKRRDKKCNLTLEDLRVQWDKQKGICPYLKIKLDNSTWNGKPKDPVWTASLDRINSSKGYIRGNIQFVSMCMNFMKYTMSHRRMLSVLRRIADEWFVFP